MKNVRVCVADDNKDEVTILCESLKLNNYEAIPAFSGSEALELCKSGKVDLLLLDIGLPDIDGIEVCKRLKADPETKDIPIIFVTAKGSVEDVALGHELGAVDYIAKPYNLPMVMVAVEMALKTMYTSAYIDSPIEFWDDPVYTDPLTGLKNYRYLMERLEEEIIRTDRYKIPLSCIALDFVDYGTDEEEVGKTDVTEDDEFLMDVALTIKQNSRSCDILTRYESSKFVIVLPNQGLENAVRYAQKILTEIETNCWEEDKKNPLPKFGIASCNEKDVDSGEEFLGIAMQNLLKAYTHTEANIVGKDLSLKKEIYI
ncbi:MAG TPA: response regulator [Candidatus Hydrogenedens sp.]|nr:response regulator [Candidatus Hydrogenedens sp.]